MNLCVILLSLAALPPAQPGRAQRVNDRPVLEQCRVSVIEEAQVPGREAGTLVDLKVHEGDQVNAGDPIGRIDDTKSKALRLVKQKEFEAAREQALNDVNVRFAKAAWGVAKAEWDKARKANENTSKAIAEIEVQKLELAAKKAELQIEQAGLEQKVAHLTAGVKQAELSAAQADLELRSIVSPLDGVVVHNYKHVGEWVPPGDPVVQIVRVDRLRVEGFVNAAEYSPAELTGREVLVEGRLARGRTVTFKGKVVFVSPIVQPGGEYLVWAEVENKQEAGQWLLRPGVTVTMTIAVK